MNNIPTLQQIKNDITADIQTQYGNTISPIGKVFLRAQAAVSAAKIWQLYMALAFVQKNIFVDTADPSEMGGTLDRFGYVKLGRNRYQATAGVYKLQVTGSIGATIPASTTFKSDDTSLSPGYLFILDSAYTLISPTDTINVRALTPGIESKLNIADTLTATSPIPLVNSSATVGVIVTPPLAAETIEDYRQKIIDSYRLEPQGGAATDYRLWSADAQGVERVYPYATSGTASSVDLYIEATTVDSTDGKGTPSAQLFLDVEAVVNFNPNTSLALNERGRRPLQVKVNYYPITVQNVDITITMFVGLTPTIQAALLVALTNMVNKIRPFVDSADIASDRNDTIDQNKVISAILNNQPGSSFGAISITVSGTPVTSYQFILGFIPNLNSVSYV